ncbi:MAG: RCC1 domain-containing protein, partial [Kofleriaceae bacterium]
GATALAAGTGHACAIVGGGAVRCWGKNDRGQVGAPRDGSMHDLVMTAVEVPGVAGAVELALGDDVSCARTATGVACWGGDVEHERGVWRATELDGATAIAASERWVCGIVAGRVRCASIETHEPAHLAPAVASARNLRGIAVHAVIDLDRICVIDRDRRAACWGHRLDQSGYFGTELKYFHGLERVRGLDGAERLVMGELELCAHTARGLACHGGRVSAGALDIALAGPRCVVSSDGAVRCTADEPGTEDATAQLEVDKLGPAVEIALGYQFACARDRAGAVRCTGSDPLAGDGRVMDRSGVPVEISIRGLGAPR